MESARIRNNHLGSKSVNEQNVIDNKVLDNVIPAEAGIQLLFCGVFTKRPDVKSAYVYLLASGHNGTLYVGVTSDLVRRVHEHKQDLTDGFTKRYRVHDLVWFEECDDVRAAIAREKQIKKWKREWKLSLIEEFNPAWRDLYADLVG